MIPLLPVFYNMKYTDKDGNLTSEAHTYNDQMFQSLDKLVSLTNATFNKDRISFPKQTNRTVNLLKDSFQIGTVWFNSDLKKLQIKTAEGIIETIQSAE